MNNTNRISKITNIQFLLSIFIVFIHSGSTAINLPGSETKYVFGMNISTIVQTFFSQGLCRVAVPLFLCISGYLFFKSFDGTFKGYAIKLKKRFFSLAIPYLFWSSAVFFAFYFAQKIPALSPYFTTRNTGELSLKIIFEDIIISSYNSPLWFCRYLIVFAILSICIYWIVKKAWFIALPFAFYGWFIGFPFSVGFRMDAVFFYLIGAFIAIHGDILLDLYLKLKGIDIVFYIAFILLLILNVLFYLQQKPVDILNGNYNVYSVYIQKITIIFGVFAVWFGYDRIFNTDTPIWKVSQYSFFIFVCHHPIVNILKKLILKIIGISNLNSLITYFLSAAITIVFVILFAILLKKVLPQLYKYISGNR